MKVCIIKANDSIERVVDNVLFAEGFAEGAATVQKAKQEQHGGAPIHWHYEEHEVEEC
jgi:hypothetical protein